MIQLRQIPAQEPCNGAVPALIQIRSYGSLYWNLIYHLKREQLQPTKTNPFAIVQKKKLSASTRNCLMHTLGSLDSSINSSNRENYTVGEIEGNDRAPLLVGKKSTYIHRPYTYLRQNIMKLILLLPLRLEMHSILFCLPLCASFFSSTSLTFTHCYAKMHISSIYLLLLPLVHRTIKYIKIIVFRCTLWDRIPCTFRCGLYSTYLDGR